MSYDRWSLRHRNRIDTRSTEALVSPVLRRLQVLWEDLREGPALPRRSGFDPLQVPRDVLPHILLADVSPDSPPRFRWRLIGTHITNAVGRDATGTWFDALYPADRLAELQRPYHTIVAHRAPLCWSADVSYLDRDWLTYEVVGLPMSEDGARIDILLLGMHYRST